MRYQGQNGKLFIVADVARMLPRHWDGPRLLRFLTGLALLALAFGAQAGLTASRLSAPAPATTSVTAIVDVPAAPAMPRATSMTTGVDVPGVTSMTTGVDMPGITSMTTSADESAGTSTTSVHAPATTPGETAVRAGDDSAVEMGALDTAVAAAGVTRRAHGSRGPPLL